jgi:uncharacterized protein YbjT (DUF2867 family)
MSAHSAPAQESYLVIGGGTTVGEHIVAQLLRRGEARVSIFDAEPLSAHQVKRFGDAVRVVVGDISVPQDLADAVKSVSNPPESFRLGISSAHLNIVQHNVHHPPRPSHQSFIARPHSIHAPPGSRRQQEVVG